MPTETIDRSIPGANLSLIALALFLSCLKRYSHMNKLPHIFREEFTASSGHPSYICRSERMVEYSAMPEALIRRRQATITRYRDTT
jgi:hypothetical protein